MGCVGPIVGGKGGGFSLGEGCGEKEGRGRRGRRVGVWGLVGVVIRERREEERGGEEREREKREKEEKRGKGREKKRREERKAEEGK